MIDYHKTYRSLEKALESIEEKGERSSTLAGILEAIVAGPGESLGITGGRLYAADPDRAHYRLEHTVGRSGRARPGFTVSTDYRPIQRLLQEGFLLMEEDDPDFDASIEGRVGARRFAAITVGKDGRHFIAFTLGEPIDPVRAVYLLGTIRHVINLRLTQEHLLHDLAEARQIQLSLLPEGPPDFFNFDIAARSVPADDVGGDLFDYPLQTPKNLGVVIADSCGHGLPAALMARDVITGLRVALDVQYRLTTAVERVNRVVAKSALASRFISLFYAEFEPSGNLVYCNAGHPPGLLWRAGRITRLKRGGMVLGPNPRARYERGFEKFPPGSTLLLYTDGITEAVSPAGKFFGAGRLERLLRETRHLPAETIVERVFAAVDQWSPTPRADDQTVFVIRRP